MKKILALYVFFLSSCSLFMHPDSKLYRDPALYGIKHEIIKFKAADGSMLTGIFFPAEGRPLATIVHFHGNSQNMSAHWMYSQPFTAAGYNVFIFDYRGFGASQGSASVSNAVEDGVAAIKQSFLLPGADKSRIIIFGQSLGGAVCAASAALTENFRPMAMIIEGSFSSYREIASAAARKKIYFWPLIWYPPLFVSDRYSPVKYLDRFDFPKLFLHSRKDKVVFFSLGKKYYERSLPPKKFLEVPDGHIEAFGAYREIFLPEALNFLDSISKN